MSPAKVAIVAVIFVCALSVLFVAPRFHSPSRPDDRADSVQQAYPPDVAIPAVSLKLAAQVAFGTCTHSSMPTAANAAEQVAACSEAIQSRTLSPSQVAFARLSRGAARVVLGDKVMAADDYIEALRHYDSAIDPSNPDALALYRRGASLEALGQSDRALTDYNEAIRVDPQEPLAYFGRGVLLATRKRAYMRAIADFDKVLALQPNNIHALIRRGDAYGQIGEFGRALVDINIAMDLAPGRSGFYVSRGLIHSRRGDKELALRDYNAALELDSRNVEALVNRAAILSMRGQEELALHDLDAALAIDGSNALALYDRGYVHFARGQYDLAIADYSGAIDLDPDMGVAYNNRCFAQAVVGRDLVRALSDCDTALKLMPTNLHARETRGFVYLKLGDPIIAIREYDVALQVDPNLPLALYGRGLARISVGQTREGEADRSAALVLAPLIKRQFSTYGL